MGTYSGEYGVINGQKTVRNWSVSESQTPFVYQASNTKGGTGRIAGITDWSGSFEQLEKIPLLLPGDSFLLQGYTAPDDGVYGSDGVTYSGQAIVDSITQVWNWAGSEPIVTTINYSSGDGSNLIIGSGFWKDDGPASISPICGLKIEQGDVGSETVIPNITTATLTLTQSSNTYINSSTNCGTGRIKGPLDWTLSLALEDNVRVLTLGSDYRLRAWVDDTNYWELEWGHVEGYTDLSVNTDGSIITQTANLSMQAINQASGLIGKIVVPGETESYWPIAVAP